MIRKNKAYLIVLIMVSVLLTGSCSINNLIGNSLSDALSLGGAAERPNPLLSENDPELIGDALPFTLKLLDILISADIDTPAIRLTAAQAYAAYAVLFLQSEANTYARDNFARRSRLLDRSKIHLLRARDYALSALDMRHTGFTAALDADDYESAFADLDAADVPYLYAAGATWVGAAAVDVFDLELTFSAARAVEMINYAFAVDPDYGGGALHEFYISFFSTLPEALGGDKERAAYHYRQALAVSDQLSASAHVSMALGIALPAQNYEQFRSFLQQALAIDPNADLNRRLTNIIRQREAQWYLDNSDQFFVDTQ